jgi:hypothetical protein
MWDCGLSIREIVPREFLVGAFYEPIQAAGAIFGRSSPSGCLTFGNVTECGRCPARQPGTACMRRKACRSCHRIV